MTEIVHALGDDKRTCKVCGGLFPCKPWVAQQADVDYTGRVVALEMYRDMGVPQDVTARMETELMGEIR